jgi:hypothetical protein
VAVAKKKADGCADLHMPASFRHCSGVFIRCGLANAVVPIHLYLIDIYELIRDEQMRHKSRDRRRKRSFRHGDPERNRLRPHLTFKYLFAKFYYAQRKRTSFEVRTRCSSTVRIQNKNSREREREKSGMKTSSLCPRNRRQSSVRNGEATKHRLHHTEKLTSGTNERTRQTSPCD